MKCDSVSWIQKGQNSILDSWVFTGGQKKRCLKLLELYQGEKATSKACPKGTCVETHTHSFRSFGVAKKAVTAYWLVNMNQENLALPMAMLYGPWGLLSDHKFQTLKPWLFTKGRNDLSSLNIHTVKWWNGAILNQPRSDGGSFKAMLADRRVLAKNTGGGNPTLHTSPNSFLPEVGVNH